MEPIEFDELFSHQNINSASKLLNSSTIIAQFSSNPTNFVVKKGRGFRIASEDRKFPWL